MSGHENRSAQPGSGSDELRGDDRDLAAALRAALASRDRSVRSARFAELWSQVGRPGGGFASRWRPAFAAGALLVVLAGLTWTLTDRTGHRDADGSTVASRAQPANEKARADLALARELSSPDYWRVPTDELLAFAAPPLSADLPSARGFDVSLEESLL